MTTGLPEPCEWVAARLGQIEGVTAVVLGGSWARGEAWSDSDLDLGIYYDPASPPSIGLLRLLARELDDRHLPDLVTEVGEWGRWINGGGWLQIEGRRVDWLYRDLGRVKWVIDECHAGRPTCDYQPGHPHGFHSHIYLAEIHTCLPLFDPEGTLPPLKARTTPYPARLRATLIEWYLWEAGFALDTSRNSAQRGDLFHVSGGLFRCAACLVQVLFALNERYFMNEKGTLPAVPTFALCPAGFVDAVSEVLARPGRSASELRRSLEQLQAVVAAVEELCAAPLRELKVGA